MTAEGIVDAENDKTKTIFDELTKVNVLIRAGVYMVITAENFPKIAEVDSSLLLLYQLDALGTMAAEASGVVRNFSQVQPVVDAMDLEFGETDRAATGIARQLFELRKNIEPGARMIFFMSDPEREALNFAIRFGLYELLEAQHFPSFTALPEFLIDEMRVEAIIWRIDRTKRQADLIRGGSPVGFGNATGGTGILNKLDARVQFLQSKAEEILERLYGGEARSLEV